MFKKIGILIVILGAVGMTSVGWQGAVAAGKIIKTPSSHTAPSPQYPTGQAFSFSRGGHKCATPTWNS